nr:hypothetical protein [Clostridiales bacterium]
PWTKLYRTSFIAENNLKYEEISTTNDITFASVSVAVAKRISYLKDYLVHYRIGQSDTISSNKPKKLGNTLIAVKSAINQASQLPYYEEIRDSVMRFTVENISYAMKNNIPDLRDPVAEQFYRDAKDLFSSPLFKDCTADRLHSPTLFDWYLFVCTFDYEELMNLFVLNFKNTDIHKMLLEKNSYYNANDELVQRKNQDRQIIVSLTSFPKRIGTVHLTIKTLLNQSLRPDKLILWLAEKEFPNREDDLPTELLKLKKQGLEICWCENIMSYKKIIPALRMYPDALIVTADDDLYYHPKWLEILYRSYLNNPHCIPCHRVTKILMAEDNTFSAIVGGKEYWDGPSYLNKLGSGSGTLFSPGCFHPDVLDETKFKELAPTNDDIWLWLMAALAGYKVIVPEDAMIGLHYIDGTQESALWQINNRGDELFWTQFYNILNAYPELKQLLSDEYVKVSSAEKAKKEMIEAQKRTFSYRARRIVTWIPRKAKGGIRCIQENGWRYTFNRVLILLRLKKPPKKEAVQVWNSSQKDNKEQNKEKEE